LTLTFYIFIQTKDGFMNFKIKFAAAAATTLLLSATAYPRPIIGSASVPNFGAVSKETAQKLRPVAAPRSNWSSTCGSRRRCA